MPPISKFFLALLFIFIYISPANAEIVNFNNGGFETGTFSDWDLTVPTPSFAACGESWDALSIAQNGNSVGGFTAHALSGTYSPYFVDFDGGGFDCVTFKNTKLNFDDGNYNFYIDYNYFNPSGGNPLLRVVSADVSKCQLSTTGTGTFTCNIYSATDFNVYFLASSAVAASGFSLDNFRYEKLPKLVHNVDEESDPFTIDMNFSITNDLRLDTNSMIVPNATCTITFDGTSSILPFNVAIQKYEYTYSTSFAKTVQYSIGCKSPNTNSYQNPDANVTGSVRFVVDLTDENKLIVTNIQNVSHSILFDRVNFSPVTLTSDIIFSIENIYTSSIDVPQYVLNNLIDDRQYFIYTATEFQFENDEWVFNDSLTFGLDETTPIQKIWDENNQRYSHSYNDTLGIGEKKYYRLVYKKPYKNYQSIKNSLDWSNTFSPTINDSNSVLVDVYQTSQFSNIRSIFIEPIPDISGSESNAYEFQFTAWADSNAASISAGQTVISTDDVTTISLSTTPRRYSFTINGTAVNSQILLKSNSTTPYTIYITDYAIVPRGYFTKRLKLKKLNNDPLDLFLLNNVSKKYLSEGKSFKFESQAYDLEGKLLQLDIEAFFGSVNDVNKLYKKIFPIQGSNENILNYDQNIDGIVDLNGTAISPVTPRDLIVRATLKDNLGRSYAEQSETVKFIQYPYFPGDFIIQLFPTEKKKGKNPTGLLVANITAPETLLGYDIRVWDTNTGTTINSPLYQKRIYKNIDFICIGSNCGFQFKLDDFIFQDIGQTYIAVTAIMNTENFTLTNSLIQSLRSIYVTTVDFDVAKIHQINERVDREYKNTEEIPLALILRSSEATDISDQINVYMTIANCNDSTPSDGTCTEQSTRFKQTGFQYDEKTNLNYYFFRHLWYLDNGNLLPDGNHIAFRAHISDSKGVSSNITSVLADKCQVNGTDFWTNAFSSIINGLGCSSPQEASVLLGNSQERAIDINNTAITTSPSQELFACINTDTNNVIDKPLEANLYCFVWYQVSEKPIDDFRLRITNQYSKLSDTGSTKQYVEFKIPYELIALNDLPLLKQELETNQQTTITTMQDFIQAGLAGVAKGAIRNLGVENLINQSSVITNIGADANFQLAFNPSSVGGFAWFVIKGIPVINAQDFKEIPIVRENFENIERTQFLNYLAENNVRFNSRSAEMQIVINSFTLPQKIVDNNGHLLIDEVATTQKINQENSDQNRQPFKFVPALLYFTIQNTMFYENHTANDSKSIVMTITTLIPQNILTGFNEFVDKLIQNPKDAIIDAIFDNLEIIIILLGLAFMISLIYVNFKNGSRG